MNILDQIQSAKPGDVVWDKGERDSVKGLHVRVSNSGEKRFFFYYRSPRGAQRRPKIGTFPELTLRSARKIVQGMWGDIAKGLDPSLEKQGYRKDLTVQETFDVAWREHWSKPRYKTSGWANEVKLNFDNHVKPVFGNLKLSEVTSSQVLSWHASYEEKSRYAGNRSLAVLARLYSFAHEKEIIPKEVNPCFVVAKHTEKKRRRLATKGEIKKIFEILEREKEKFPEAVAFIYVLMFTGSRPRALERATRKQLQTFEHEGKLFGKITFHGKTSSDSGEDETVIIPHQVISLLNSIPVPRDGSLLGVKLPRRLWAKIKKEVGCDDLWARDWRRTFSSLGLSNGLKMDAISEILNHKSTQTTKVYAKLLESEKIEAVSQIAETLDEIKSSSLEVSPAQDRPALPR